MNRNIAKERDRGLRIATNRPRLDMHLPEYRKIVEIYNQSIENGKSKNDALMELITTSYYSGLSIGYRNS